jgi:glucan endo-1,6-beta-glucosidase
MQNWASGAIAWTLGSDTNYGPYLPGGCDTCRGLVTLNTEEGTYKLNTDFYMMVQFSRFVRPGALALSTTGSYDYGNGSKVEAQAFRNSNGGRVLVIENTFDNDIYLSVDFKSGDQWSGPLYAQSTTTWNLPA